MRKLIFLMLMMISVNSDAKILIKCYLPDGSKWEGWGYNIWVSDDYILFTHEKNIRMRIPGKCLVASNNPADLG